MKPPAIPDHTLLRPIGRGSYGEVWLARNVMGTLRAVKIIWRRQFDSERPYEREFAGIQRYEPLSRSADGLVHVLHVGRNDEEGCFYYVMELADNGQRAEPGQEPTPITRQDGLAYSPRTLRSEMKRLGRLATADCLRIALDIASGLGQLHRRGLVHRDVKPGNIIYVGDRAKLADLGLVSAGGERGTFVGTEGYIPPEGPGSPGADIYALGVALYEASTGYSPDKFPEAPREWFAEEAASAPLEFHQVILKACEGQAERRYANVEAMQADLALLQSGQSIRHLRALELRLRRWRRVGSLAALAIAMASAAAGLAHYRAGLVAENLTRESRLREQAQKARERAESAENATRRQLYTALLEQARATVRSGELGQRANALNAVRQAAMISNDAELRRVAVAAMMLPDFRFEREIPTGPGVTLAQLDPEFRRIALGRGSSAVEIRSVADQALVARLPAGTNLPVYAGWWSPDGQYLAVKRDQNGNGDLANLEVWDVEHARLALRLRDVAWGAMSFHPHRNQFISGRTGGGVSLWDLGTGQEIRRLQLPSTPIRLCFAPDGERFAAVCEGKGGEDLWVCEGTNGMAQAHRAFPRHLGVLAWHPAGRWVSVPDSSGTVSLVDSLTGEALQLGHHRAEAVTTAFSPGGAYLVSGGWDRELICWNLETMQKTLVMGLGGFLVQFPASGTQCAVVTDAGAQLYSFDQPGGHEFVEDLGPRVRNAAFSPDGRWLAASGDEQLAVWNLSANAPGALVTNGSGSRLFFSGDGTELFANREADVFRWQVAEATDANAPPKLRRLEFPSTEGLSSFCLASNTLALTAARGSSISTLDHLPTPNLAWARTSEGINCLSSDGRWLGIYSPFSAALNIFGLPGLEQVARLTNGTSIASFAFAPSGEELAIASRNALEFWSTKTWTRTRLAPNFMGIIFSPDGRTGWLSQNFHSAGLYDTHTLELLLPLPAGMGPLAVSQDGRWLAASVDARRVRVLDLNEMRRQFRVLGVDWDTATAKRVESVNR